MEQVLRRAWVQVISGRQEGRVYLLGRKVSTLKLDERADVGLFGDRGVARRHAEIEVDIPGLSNPQSRPQRSDSRQWDGR